MAALLLVPSSLRASRAARRLCDAEGGLLFGARVVTPESLLPGLLAAAGERRPILTPLAERLLALEVGEGTGGPFARLDPAGGLARALAAALAELRRGEVTAEVAAETAASLAGPAGERLGALARALARYEERLESAGALDRAGAFRAAVAAARRGAGSEETSRLELLVIEGFHAPSPGEWDLFAALAARARRSIFRVPALPERPDLCAAAGPLLRRIEGLHGLTGARAIEIVLPAADDRAPRLARVLRGLAGGAPGEELVDGGAGQFVAAAGAGEQGELERAAAALARLLASGVPAEEIRVFAAAPARVAGPLRRACQARGVPLAAGWEGRLSDVPVVRAVLAALRLAFEPGREELLAWAGSTYLGAPPSVERLGRLLDRSGFAGDGAVEPGRRDPEAALRRRADELAPGRPERRELLAAAVALREAKERLRPFRRPARAAAFAASLATWIEAGGLRRRAARGDPARAALDLAALDRLVEAGEELARARALIGRAAEPIDPERWMKLLSGALAAAAAPAHPEPAARAVELWPLSEAPGLAGRAAVVLGCARGRFPAPLPPEPLLREAERLAVNGRVGRGALATASARRADALLAAVGALAAGGEAVICTFAGAGPEGQGDVPAPLVAEAALLAATEVEPPPADPPPAEAATESEALRAAVRAGSEAAAPVGLAARARDALARGAVEAERRTALEERRPSLRLGQVPPAVLEPSLPEEWSASQLESYARCPFKLFVEMALRLREPESGGLDVDPRDEGSLAHAVMEELFRARIERGEGPLTGAPEEPAALRQAAAAVFRRFEAEGRVGDAAVWAARRGAVLGRLLRAIALEAEEGGALAPALVEHRFGGRAPQPALVFGEGERMVKLRGRLDRVDAGPDRLLVIDYKNSRDVAGHRQKLQGDDLGVTNFQIPAYLLAAAQALPGRRQLAASYRLLRAPTSLAPLELEADCDLLALEPGRRAAVRASGGRTFADAVVELVDRVRAGELAPRSRGCQGCGFGAICRVEFEAEGEP